MKLLDIIRREATGKEGLTEMVISVDFGDGAETIPFGYQEGDTTGLSSQVAEWLTENQIAIDAYTPPPISELRLRAEQDTVRFANSITASILAKYPEAEQRLWGDLKKESLAYVVDAEDQLANLPVLNQMLTVKYGTPSNDAEAWSRIAIAAPNIITNANNWTAIAEHVAGLRARVFGQIETAATQIELDTILLAAKAEAEATATSMGLI